MENRENARYIVLANVDGKKTAIQFDGLYTILPPQNFPSQVPKEIQYKEERLPLYNAREFISGNKKKSRQEGSYEKLYRDLLGKVKDISDEIIKLKKNLFTNIEQDLTQITKEKIPATSGQLSSILNATEEAANNIMDLTEKVQESQNKMVERFNIIKNALEGFKKQENQLLENINELEELTGENDSNLTSIVTSLSFQDLTGQKLQKLVRLQDEVESKLISILFNFGIKLRQEENPDDESIKKGEKMLDLLQGERKEDINQDEVDQLLGEFLR